MSIIEQKARDGKRQLPNHELHRLTGLTRIRVSQGEKAAALEGLRNLGYTVDEAGVSW